MTEMKEFHIESKKSKKRLFCALFSPTLPERGIVMIIHGYAEYCKPYYELSTLLAKEGYIVGLFDLQGHGNSEGDRVLIHDFNDYLLDLKQVTEEITKIYDNLPVFLLGHSMGGTIAIKAGSELDIDIKGIILLGPAIQLDPELTPLWKLGMVKVLGRIAPSLQLGKMDASLLTHDQEYLANMNNDNLIWKGGMKARFAVSFLKALNDVSKKIESIEFPFLILHGACDKVCSLAGSEFMALNASSEDKTLKIYPNAFHSLLHEEDHIKNQVFRDISMWLENRSAVK